MRQVMIEGPVELIIHISTSDDGSGTLTVSTRITGTDGTDITYEYTQSKQKAETGVAQVVFNNTYTSSTNTEGYDASVNLTGTKTLTNRPMVDGEFQFNVLSNGSVVSSGTNTADGIVTFTPINYTNDQLIQDHANGIASKEGNTYTYVYDVEEVTPSNGVSIVAGKRVSASARRKAQVIGLDGQKRIVQNQLPHPYGRHQGESDSAGAFRKADFHGVCQ